MKKCVECGDAPRKRSNVCEKCYREKLREKLVKG
jgi:NMD protein affecting ribosome stability and mRNA decay